MTVHNLYLSIQFYIFFVAFEIYDNNLTFFCFEDTYRNRKKR